MAVDEAYPLTYRTCLDRHYVQLELRVARESNKPVITLFEDDPRKQAHFDYASAWAK